MRKYRLIAELGHGGMADVFLAVSPGPAGFNKLVVIKQLRPSLVEDEVFLNMFLDEARLAARLNHPNVVHTYEVGHDEALPYLAMEYLDGQPLHRVLQKLGRHAALPLEAHVRVLSDALVGLHYAHELRDYDGSPLNVVHRDVTPHNVFVTYEGAIKVVDFGIAKAMSQSVETRTGIIKGKIAYMSPEQARSEAVDRRSDLFAMGVMLWEAAAGRRLWKDMSDVSVLQQLVSGSSLPSPRTFNAEVPEELDRICQKALCFAPAERYANAAEMQADLEAFLDRRPSRLNGRDVGKIISERFARERELMQATIDQQLKGGAAGGPSGTFALPMLGSSMGRTHFGGGALGEEMSVSGQLLGATSSHNSFVTGAAVAPVASSGAPGRARRGLVLGALGAGGVAAMALGWVTFVGRGAPAGEANGAGRRELPEAVLPTEIMLSVRVSPPTAQVFLDDHRLEGNPYQGPRPRSNATHRLRAEAPGYVTQVREVALGSDLTVELSLDREAAAAPPGAPSGEGSKASSTKAPLARWTAPAKAPAKAAPPAAPAPSPPPVPKAKPSVTLDTDNPWLPFDRGPLWPWPSART